MPYTIGVDINSKYSQLSVFTDSDKNPVPVSAVMGQDFYEIPTMVAYVEDQNRWCYGYEAYSLSSADAAIPVENLLFRAMADESITIKGEEYLISDLLELYIKKLLGMANLIGPYQMADAIVFSAELLDHESIGFLNNMIKRLNIDDSKIFLYSHSECIHHYMIHQNKELWSNDVLVLDYAENHLFGKIYKVSRNKRPIVCTVDEYKFDIDTVADDESFLPVVEELLSDRIISAVYLIGDSELESRCPKSISRLCGKRRVFMGRNMYTRGACYASLNHVGSKRSESPYLFLGKDKLKCNVAVWIKNEDMQEVVSELLEAGINWYDVNVSTQYYTDIQREVRIVLFPIDGTDERNVIVRLNDFPKRPPHCTRIKLTITMSEPDVICLKITDLGFGEIFPASDIEITEIINLGEI